MWIGCPQEYQFKVSRASKWTFRNGKAIEYESKSHNKVELDERQPVRYFSCFFFIERTFR